MLKKISCFILVVLTFLSCNVHNEIQNDFNDEQTSLSSPTKVSLSNHQTNCPSFNYYDSIGILHNELLSNQLANLYIPISGECDINLFQLMDYYLQNFDSYLSASYSDYYRVRDYTNVFASYMSFEYSDYFRAGTIYSAYVDSIQRCSEVVLSNDLCEKLRNLQRNFYNVAFVNNHSELYYSDSESAELMMVMLSVAANSAKFWNDTNNRHLLFTTFDVIETPELGMKWWKADMIAAAVGWVTVWWGSILWGAVASIVAVIQNLVSEARTGNYSVTIHENYQAVDRYNLFVIGESSNPYLYRN